jgi:hypothetical protein
VIAAVTDALRRLSLLAADEPVRYQIGLTKGDTLWLDVFRRDGSYLHVKAAEFITLRDEARVYADAFSRHGEYMPEPRGFTTCEGWELLIAEGVEHRPLHPNPLADAPGASLVAREIWRYFAAASRTPRDEDPRHAHESLVGRLRQTFRDSPFAPLVAQWSSESALGALAALGAVAQHGDFVENNLGMTPRGLRVFDWEDFGKVALPGFDLCTLAVSLANGIAPDADMDRHGPLASRIDAFVAPACESLGLDLDTFWHLVPLYLLAFLHLKQGYATGVRDRTARLLQRLCNPAARGLRPVTLG